MTNLDAGEMKTHFDFIQCSANVDAYHFTVNDGTIKPFNQI